MDTLPDGSLAPVSLLVFSGDRIMIKKTGTGCGFPSRSDLPDATPHGKVHFIGASCGLDFYAFHAAGPETAVADDFEYSDLRGLLGLFDEEQARLVFTAAQVLYWDRVTAFCGECGSATGYSDSERAKKCPKCSRSFYPAVTPAIIVAVMNGDKILLAHNKSFAEGVYSLVAGFVEPGESLEECVRREVLEETGVSIENVRYFKSQPWPFPSSLMIGFTASYAGGDIRPDGAEITAAAWFGRGELPKLPRPGSLSRKIIDALTGAGGDL